MDSVLIDYLKSGKAWVLVGSGPSLEMGYPSLQQLASYAVELVRVEKTDNRLKSLEAAMETGDFPGVFELAKAILGGERLLQHLQDKLRPSGRGRIYELIARWPVQVYLTTNYDNEIQKHLATLGEDYETYNNSEDHFAHLLPELEKAIFKLHGDLRSQTGLILAASEYRGIVDGDNWTYWRTKMTSIFQMAPVVIIGHSLNDPNIKHVLQAAKRGSGVLNPICWIAPNVSPQDGNRFLEEFRIRVIPYEDDNGNHRHLVPLIENVTDFIPPRTAIRVRRQIERIGKSPLGANAAAPAFFVFNKLTLHKDFEQQRIDIIIAAIQSALPKLISMDEFTLQQALEMLGWPEGISLGKKCEEKISVQVIEQELLTRVGEKFRVCDSAEMLALENRKLFERMRDKFKRSLVLRIKRDYQVLSDKEASQIASDIEESLTGYFREGGLSLASTLYSSGERLVRTGVPRSVMKFITEASARYSSWVKRQAFCKASVDAFVRAEPGERHYLARIAQGFFAFHSLGAFGDVAIERLRRAKDTVWLLDSEVQIPALALAAPGNAIFDECIEKLHQMGIRLFTTEELFQETREHLWFANKVVKDYGPDSLSVIAAATGQAPYDQSNLFLDGFIRWRSAGNPCDWGSYLFQIFGHYYSVHNICYAIGVEKRADEDWVLFNAGKIRLYSVA